MAYDADRLRGPRCNPLAIADIALGDVKACLLPHWEERPVTADRLRARIQAVIDYAIAHGWRTAGNPARWQGLLDKVMPPRRKLSARAPCRELPNADAPKSFGRVCKTLDRHGGGARSNL